MRKLTHEEIVTRQKEVQALARLPFCVLLNNIRSLYNVGSIFRTADGAGVEKIYLCGITGTPPNNRIAKTALGAHETVPWEYYSDPRDILLELQKQGYELLLLEQTSQSIPYHEFESDQPVCLVLGHECDGVEESLVDLCHRAIDIEMAGIKNSLNVSVAFGVVAYHMRQALKGNGSKIKSS